MELEQSQITERQRNKISKQAIASQTLGMQGMLAFGNGILLLYMTTLGFTIIPIGGFFSLKQAEIIIVAGISVLAIGKTLFAPTWMPIIDSFVDPNKRGQFFGRLRITVQLVGLIVSALTAWYVRSSDDGSTAPVSKYIVVLFVLSLFLFGRLYFYSRIPEITKKDSRPHDIGLFKAIGEILSNGDFISFCLYIFMLVLFTAGCGNLFSLVEKNVMKLSSSYIILLSNTTMIGAMVGLFIGGKVIDRYGSKFAFLFCHLAFVFTIGLFLMRDSIPTPIIFVIIAHFSLGLIGSFSGLARSTETLALIPEHNKSLSTSVAMSLMLGAQALSGLMAAWALSVNLINPNWKLFGNSMSSFDGILLIYGIMTFLFIVTLSMVPSVLRKSTWGAMAN
jgi:hypothetical protein